LILITTDLFSGFFLFVCDMSFGYCAHNYFTMNHPELNYCIIQWLLINHFFRFFSFHKWMVFRWECSYCWNIWLNTLLSLYYKSSVLQVFSSEWTSFIYYMKNICYVPNPPSSRRVHAHLQVGSRCVRIQSQIRSRRVRAQPQVEYFLTKHCGLLEIIIFNL
jgi:hypothetical protein